MESTAFRVKVITVHQPWAWLIVAGHKKIENRTWAPPPSMIGGRLMIHAGQTIDDGGYRAMSDLGIDPPPILHRGAVIGSVQLDKAITRPPCPPDPYWFGPVGWVLSDPHEYATPVRTGGKLRIWYPDDPKTVTEIVRLEQQRRGIIPAEHTFESVRDAIGSCPPGLMSLPRPTSA